MAEFVPKQLEIDLYGLLPPIYRKYDEALGEPLKKFLDPMQMKLDEIYQDQQRVALVQDPDWCREDFLAWIARSLGWNFLSSTTEGRRLEVREIVNFYDLKGTPYAIRLFSSLIFGPYFKRLYEFYDGGEGSISTIREDYENFNYWLRYLLEGHGEFAVQSWKDAKIAERGRPYSFDKDHRYYSYVVYNFVSPRIYQPGDLRPRVIRFVRNYQKWHPAGRYCYLVFHMPIGNDDESRLADLMIDELSGVPHFDSYWRFDEGMHFDQGPGPVHDSISTLKIVQYRHFDEGEQEVAAQGDGVTTSFSGQLIYEPLNPYGVTFKATVNGNLVIIPDDGQGNLASSNQTVTGTINYSTGEWSLQFTDPPDDGTNIVAVFLRLFDEGWHFDETYSLAGAVIELD